MTDYLKTVETALDLIPPGPYTSDSSGRLLGGYSTIADPCELTPIVVMRSIAHILDLSPAMAKEIRSLRAANKKLSEFASRCTTPLNEPPEVLP